MFVFDHNDLVLRWNAFFINLIYLYPKYILRTCLFTRKTDRAPHLKLQCVIDLDRVVMN